MTEANKTGTETPEPDGKESTGGFPSCGSGCACNEPTDKLGKKTRLAICLITLVAVAGILAFKTTNARQNPPLNGNSGFSNTLVTKGAGAVTTSADQQGGRGASLSAIADLNTVAAKLNTVFLVIPSKDNAPTSKDTTATVKAVEHTLNAKGLSTGIFTLQAASPDYPDVAAKVKVPGIAVLTKGGGIGFVAGAVSEASLMQAYVASTRGGGCCPTGGSSSGKPCK